MINGQSPVPPPDIPQERLNLPPIPTGPSAPDTQRRRRRLVDRIERLVERVGLERPSPGTSSQRQGNQHLPARRHQPPAPAPRGPAPGSRGPPPPGGAQAPPPPAPEPPPPPPPGQ